MQDPTSSITSPLGNSKEWSEKVNEWIGIKYVRMTVFMLGRAEDFAGKITKTDGVVNSVLWSDAQNKV